MTKLNLLGAQRVKALTGILERKYSDKIAEVKQSQMSDEAVLEVLAKESGSEGLLKEINGHVDALMALQSEAASRLGLDVYARSEMHYWKMGERVKETAKTLADNGVSDKVEKLRRELEDKKSQLWLVETLEEAQAIVQSEIIMEDE